MIDNDTHTDLDHAALLAGGWDPDACQPRTRPHPCHVCGGSTWNVMGCCDRHYQAPPPNKSATRAAADV